MGCVKVAVMLGVVAFARAVLMPVVSAAFPLATISVLTLAPLSFKLFSTVRVQLTIVLVWVAWEVMSNRAGIFAVILVAAVVHFSLRCGSIAADPAAAASDSAVTAATTVIRGVAAAS
jgi:hypothetical protein